MKNLNNSNNNVNNVNVYSLNNFRSVISQYENCDIEDLPKGIAPYGWHGKVELRVGWWSDTEVKLVLSQVNSFHIFLRSFLTKKEFVDIFVKKDLKKIHWYCI